MNQQYTQTPSSYVVDPDDREPPECPPEAEYVVRFMGIQAIGPGKPFREGDEPKTQFTLDFKIDGTDGTPLQQEWHMFDLIGWFSPIMHYNPNLPGYGGQRYTEPNLYKLVKAMNGDVPLDLPIIRDEQTGEPRYAPYDAAELLRQFVDKRFRSVIGPNRSGWPRLKGNPMAPLSEPTGRRRRSGAQPEPVPAGGVAEGSADPFLDEDL